MTDLPHESLTCSTTELHQAILDRRVDHGVMEAICIKRIAAVPRLPLSRDGRWWSYPNAYAYPFGN